jgi:FkbM family methyltransferase
MRRVFAGCYDIPGLSFETPPTILDIGANVGASTLWFGTRWPGCTVQAYEPHPGHAASFIENLRESGVNATLHPVAVVGPNWPAGKLMLFEGAHGPRERSLYQLGSQQSNGVSVDTMPARELPPADILKVDTEGCEVEITFEYQHLAGVKAVLLECHRKRDYPLLVERMRQNGLRLIRDDSRHGEWIGEVIFLRS